MAGCYRATGQPVFPAVAFLGHFEILQQLIPAVRMDGYFILADLTGIPDPFGLLALVMASMLPGRAGRHGREIPLRRASRMIITTWVLMTVPLLAAITGYTLWNLPRIALTTARSFAGGLSAAEAAFSGSHLAAGLAGILAMVLLAIPAGGLIYLFARLAVAGIRAAARPGSRRS